MHKSLSNYCGYVLHTIFYCDSQDLPMTLMMVLMLTVIGCSGRDVTECN